MIDWIVRLLFKIVNLVYRGTVGLVTPLLSNIVPQEIRDLVIQVTQFLRGDFIYNGYKQILNFTGLNYQLFAVIFYYMALKFVVVLVISSVKNMIRIWHNIK